MLMSISTWVLFLKEQGKIEAAKSAYSKAFQINPNFFDAYNNMGILLKDQGELEEAIVAFKEALKIEPRNADVYFNMICLPISWEIRGGDECLY